MTATTATAELSGLKSWPAALAEAAESLSSLGLPDVLPALHSAGLGISRSVLGGSHSVAVYPPIDSLEPVSSDQVLEAIGFGPETSLYVHVPFCETRCTFCHYAVEHYPRQSGSPRGSDARVTRYLGALERELAFWGGRLARSGTALSSIYIGGGTPLVLPAQKLAGLFRAIGDTYAILPGAEVCIEGSPLTITAPDGEDKLRSLKEQGFTRLSFGVQSFDDAVLKYAARGYKRDVPIRAAHIASGVFDNWNLDLIQGLYKGSPAETWGNLRVVAELQPAHLTWYHGRFANRPQGDWYKSGERRGSFEDEEATLLGRMLIWQGMAALGYERTDGNRFVQDRHFTDRFKTIRTSPSHDLLGVGASSYSHVSGVPRPGRCRGYVFRNETRIGAYADRVLSGDVPFVTGRAIDDGELLAMSFATGLRSGRVDTAGLRSIAARYPRLAEHYGSLTAQLSDLGILEPYTAEHGENGLRLTELGRLFEDETLALFFSPAVKHAVRTATTGERL
jgi:coproporphyrinogen III oxidase-like Fe-S oxidoreductase